MEKEKIRRFAYFFVFTVIIVLVSFIVVADIKYRRDQKIEQQFADNNAIADNTDVHINDAIIKNFLASNYEILSDNGIDVDELNTDDYIFIDDTHHIEYYQRLTGKYLDIWFDESFQIYDFDVRSKSYAEVDRDGKYVQEGGYEQHD